jgi:hypothetical protein
MADITRKDVERRVKRGESLKEIDMTGLNLDDFNFEGAIFTSANSAAAASTVQILHFHVLKYVCSMTVRCRSATYRNHHLWNAISAKLIYVTVY